MPKAPVLPAVWLWRGYFPLILIRSRECLSPKDAKYRVVSVKKEYDDNNCQYLYDVDLEEV